MPQLLPFYFVNQLTWTLAGLVFLIYVISIYVLPYFVHIFVTRVYVTRV